MTAPPVAGKRLAFLQHSPTDVPGVLGLHARRLGFAVTAHRADTGPPGLPADTAFDGLVVMGSVASVNDDHLDWVRAEREFVARAVGRGVPVLGVCFGGQLLARVLGGAVRRAAEPEVGWLEVATTDPSAVPAGRWLLWHEDAFTAPAGAALVATTPRAEQAFLAGPHTGLQFHPEVTAAIVHRWFGQAQARGQVSDAERRALLGTAERYARASAAHARTLLDAHLARAGLLPAAAGGG
jgi:GMP synthase-like glutamine amidotransferase